MEKIEPKRMNGTLATVRQNDGLVQLLCSLCAMYKNTGIKWVFLKAKKKLKPLIPLGLSLV